MGKIIEGTWQPRDTAIPIMSWSIEKAVGIQIIEDREGGETMTWDEFIAFAARIDRNLCLTVLRMRPEMTNSSLQGVIKIAHFDRLQTPEALQGFITAVSAFIYEPLVRVTNSPNI